jgi:D-alanyl-D-alanine carboxypeptidase/D-alanyl-D-alanine-endopeptidase (penicillin-binding protein 4)
VLLVVLCISGLSLAVQSERGAAAEPVTTAAAGSTPVATPVLSARRVPELIASRVADRRLDAHIDELLAAAPPDTCLTVAVGGRIVYSKDPDRSLVPASIEKLMTAEAALAVLGPDDVLTTKVASDVQPQAGVLDGNVFMIGGGDPLLMTDPYVNHFKHQPVVHSSLETLADRVVAAGITRITGGVVGDESRYDRERYLPQWPARFQTSAEIGPMGALMVNDGLVAFPPTPDVRTPKETPADDPAVHAADQLTQLLRARGVTIDREASSGVTPQEAHDLASLDSEPVRNIVAAMLTESDNGTAELLTKEIGVHQAGDGTTASGTAAITASLSSRLSLDGTRQFDGSGLASENRVTCTAVQSLLDQDGPHSTLASMLPVAGQTGTLAERFLTSPANGRVRAKTGTLNEATALAGYVDSAQGVSLSFTFLMNTQDPRRITADDVALEDQLADLLVGYPEAVDVSQIGPRP